MAQQRKNIHLNFDEGVYQDLTKDLLPFKRGIYLAYTGELIRHMYPLINYFILVWRMTRQ